MLKLAGEGVVAERIERLTYTPGLQGSGDLEPTTRTITATVEATGIANRDYQATLTLPAPADARLAVMRIAARLATTIDSMTAGTLYCRVYVDALAANNRLLDLSWTTTGAKLTAVDTHSDNLATIFNLLKDGAAHTFYFFFWVNAGNAVLSVVELWEGVASTSTTYWGDNVLSLVHTGYVRVDISSTRVGTGTWAHVFGEDTNLRLEDETGAKFLADGWVIGTQYLRLWGTVATDLNYLATFQSVLRREQ